LLAAPLLGVLSEFSALMVHLVAGRECFKWMVSKP
jgi:hypothetical protein